MEERKILKKTIGTVLSLAIIYVVGIICFIGIGIAMFCFGVGGTQGDCPPDQNLPSPSQK